MKTYRETAQYLSDRIATAGKEMPRVAVVLGSGLGRLADMIEQPLTIPYNEIPHFKQSTAVGHKGNLIIGNLAESGEWSVERKTATPENLAVLHSPLSTPTIMVMQGRFHYYEGHTIQDVVFPMRVFASMGVKTVLVSNAAGAVNPEYKVGDLMVIYDHINFMPNPLVGPNDEEMGPRFPDMTEAYSRRLRDIADHEAAKMGITLRHGVYVAGTGPTYETPAEYRMYRTMGGDACGMSTVPEVIVARHSGMEVFGMSVITNQSNDLGNGTVNDGDDVVKQADAAAVKMTELFSRIIANA